MQTVYNLQFGFFNHLFIATKQSTEYEIIIITKYLNYLSFNFALRLGATLSNFNSTIYIYTDAPAKDESRETEVIEILQRKTITPKFRLRNECVGRRKREIGVSFLYFIKFQIYYDNYHYGDKQITRFNYLNY